MSGRKWRRCPHVRIRGIYGDEIMFATPGFRRLQCVDCGRHLDGPVSLATTDSEAKLAAVRELRDATAALCHPPVPTDDDPMSQGAWAARREVVDALNALLDGEDV